MFYIEPELRRYLRRLTEPFAKFLENVLKPLYPYSNDWWRTAVLNSFDLNRQSDDRKNEIRSKSNLSEFDMYDLFLILKYNWNRLDMFYNNRSNSYKTNFKHFLTFEKEKRETFNRMLDLRNDISHKGYPPITTIEEAYNYLDVINDFAEIINAKKSLNKSNQNILVDFLKTNVLKPLEENKELKQIALDTYPMLDRCTTSIHVEFFFWYNIYNDEGIESFKKLTDARLKTFEYYRKEFKELCGTSKEF